MLFFALTSSISVWGVVNSSYPWKQMVTVMHFCPQEQNFSFYNTRKIQLFGFCDVRLISFYLIYAVNLYILISE